MDARDRAVIRALSIVLQAEREPEWAAWTPSSTLKWTSDIVRHVADDSVRALNLTGDKQ